MKIVNGDLFEIIKNKEAVAVLHQVNCVGAMGAGFAKQLAALYPQTAAEYKQYCQTAGCTADLVGDMLITQCKGILFAHSFSQQYCHRNVKQTYERLLVSNISKFIKRCKRTHRQLYMPFQVGCGLAGGNWAVIASSIASLEVLHDYEVVLVKMEGE